MSGVLLLIMVVFAMLGMELFGGKLGAPAPRTNFDYFTTSFITVFVRRRPAKTLPPTLPPTPPPPWPSPLLPPSLLPSVGLSPPYPTAPFVCAARP